MLGICSGSGLGLLCLGWACAISIRVGVRVRVRVSVRVSWAWVRAVLRLRLVPHLTLTLRNVVSLDLRWNRILQKQDSYLRFALNAAEDSLPTPSRLKHWQQDSAGNGLCSLGCRVTGSLWHNLCQCQKSIKEVPQSLIAWRHDSILLAIY